MNQAEKFNRLLFKEEAPSEAGKNKAEIEA